MNSMNPMNQGGGSPQDPMSQDFSNKETVSPVYEETTSLSKVYKVIIGIMGLIIVIELVLLILFIPKATKSDSKINSQIADSNQKVKDEMKQLCELEKKDIRENPWTDFNGRDTFGAFKFTVPRNWANYEVYDINANHPYTLFFNPDMVAYDSGLRYTHSALEVTISKRLYSSEVKEIKDRIKEMKDVSAIEEPVNISNFTGTKFVYKNKDLKRRIGIVVLPYRDRAFFIKTDDYDKWNEKYYDKFYKSFTLTP